MKRQLIGAVLFAVYCTSASAATVVWDEAVNGDADTSTTISLTNGDNLLRGGVFEFRDEVYDESLGQYVYPYTYDHDSFKFSLTPGESITGITVTGLDGYADSVSFTLHRPLGSTLDHYVFSIPGASVPIAIFSAAMPLTSPGIFELLIAPHGYSPLGAFSASYEVTITAALGGAVVPVPAAVWLFGSALGVMGVMRRKLAS